MVCKVRVFAKGSSATENSIIAAGRSMIVENNYGYHDPTDTENGKVTAGADPRRAGAAGAVPGKK